MITKTGTTQEQTRVLLENGLKEEYCDVQTTIKLIKETGTELKILKSVSLAKLLTLIPNDLDHKIGISGTDEGGWKITVSSKKEKYRKTVSQDCLVDSGFEIVLYLLKKKVI
jgi:hypothetical protein